MICATLNAAHKNMVDFDPTNPEHLKAYRSLCIGEDEPTGVRIKQHPTLRFNIQAPFETVPAMLQYKIGQAYLDGRVL